LNAYAQPPRRLQNMTDMENVTGHGIKDSIRVIGVPRSGTNLLKFMIETHSKINCFFNVHWWKHAVIPPLMMKNSDIMDDIPTVVMFRNPVAQIVSFYNFSIKGRTAMRGEKDLSAFVESPIFMKPPNESIEYRYSSPVEYWIQYYYSALSVIKTGRRNYIFLSLEAINRDPGIISNVVRNFYPEAECGAIDRLPSAYMGRNGDTHVSDRFSFEQGMSIETEKNVVSSLLRTMSPLAEKYICNLTTTLYAQARSIEFKSHVA
jgi:hypothetical protein